MRHRQKALSVLLTLAIAVGLLPWAVLPARAAEEVTVTDETDEWENGNTYKVTRDVAFGRARIQVNGTVSLVLGEGKTLTVPLGIHVPASATLNISGTGALVIEGGSSYNPDYYHNKAGIGGNNEGEACGTVTISGGTVTATGGRSSVGIGGGYCGAGGTVTVTGGTVYATGGAPYTTGGQQCAAVGGTLDLSNVAAGESDDGSNYTALTSNSSKKPYLHFCAPSLTGGVTAPAGAVLVCATYKDGRMTGVQTLTLAADCIGEAASELLPVPASGQYKLFLLDKTTYAPLCAAWDNKQ